MKVYIGPYKDDEAQKIEVAIHNYDTWSMDDTLAPIILPMLKQLKETKHSAPTVEFKDVPEEFIPPDVEAAKKLYMKNGETDENYFKRWDYVLDEMIWAFEQKCRDDWHDDYYGDYIEDEKSGPLGGRFEWINHDGMKKHQKRMSNGFRLFGKYYENLWD